MAYSSIIQRKQTGEIFKNTFISLGAAIGAHLLIRQFHVIAKTSIEYFSKNTSGYSWLELWKEMIVAPVHIVHFILSLAVLILFISLFFFSPKTSSQNWDKNTWKSVAFVLSIFGCIGIISYLIGFGAHFVFNAICNLI